ncbi:MAG: ABC transporter substrate-binding protein [Bacillota bacterium]
MKRIVCLLAVVLLVLSLFGCAQQSPAATQSPTAAAKAGRIVCLHAAATEIVFALGMGDKVVGVDSYSNYPAETAKLPKVGDFNGPNLEAIQALEPDVIFAAQGLQKDVVKQLTDMGANVVVNEATSYADIYDKIELTAQAIGADATKVISDMHQKEEEAKAIAAADGKTPKVYYVISYGDAGDYTCGKGAFITDMLAMVKADSVTKDINTPWPSYTREQIFADDPDVILISGTQTDVDTFKASANYKDLRAVKEGKVYAIDRDTSSRSAPRIVDALVEMAKILHPTQ